MHLLKTITVLLKLQVIPTLKAFYEMVRG
ncbi:hypothetical protein CIY_24790 [Butyrivibrio fibrisolvens 16/4]|nr:hypothetical protein CIY_24790 [Butyrivibrio fibrisolvens 16/4]